jgi:L-ribulose-5-phosphate 4-epimerase
VSEGYIKFNCCFNKKEVLGERDIVDLNKCREKFFDLNLIGMYENGIGFGNISKRIDNSEKFIISGSATGGIKDLSSKNYAIVDEINFEENYLSCTGLTKASSESMTHAAVYASNEKIKAVIHIHNLDLWKKLINILPITKKEVPYGTPEMADEVKRLFKETNVFEKQIFAMGGHKEGIISFGKSLDDAGKIILKYFNNFF